MGLPRYDFTAGTALLTGAAHGIGEQLALGLAGRGSRLVLLDRDADGLASVAQRLRESHPDLAVSTLCVDLADRAERAEATASVVAAHPDLTLLINNAGVALGGYFEHVTLAEFEWVMEVNFAVPVALTHALLPTLLANPGSHVVNMSSVFGLFGPPGQAAYSSSKFALRGFSEVLRAELADRQVGVTVVHPGGIRTQIAESARVGTHVPPDLVAGTRQAFEKLLTYPADRAAAEILDAVHRRRERVLIAPTATVPDLVVRALPTRYRPVLAGLTRVIGRLS